MRKLLISSALAALLVFPQAAPALAHSTEAEVSEDGVVARVVSHDDFGDEDDDGLLEDILGDYDDSSDDGLLEDILGDYDDEDEDEDGILGIFDYDDEDEDDDDSLLGDIL